MHTKLHLLLGLASNLSEQDLKTILKSLHRLSECFELHIQAIANNEMLTTSNDSSVKEYIEKVYTDKDEWELWKKIGDPVLHIDLTKWADIFVLAPMDLDTMAKVAIGICDNLLTCTLRAWNLEKPVIFSPNLPTSDECTNITQSHISMLKTWGYHEISLVKPCISINNDLIFDYSVEGPKVNTEEMYHVILELLKCKS